MTDFGKALAIFVGVTFMGLHPAIAQEEAETLSVAPASPIKEAVINAVIKKLDVPDVPAQITEQPLEKPIEPKELAEPTEPAKPTEPKEPAEKPTPSALDHADSGSPATISLLPHNTKFDKAQARHNTLVLAYISATNEINALVQRSLALQHKQDLLRTDMRMTARMIEDTRSRKSKAKMQLSMDKWEQALAALDDDAQLANIDLQSALQKQQQTLQTLSNVSKMMHDTAMAIIRKIGG